MYETYMFHTKFFQIGLNLTFTLKSSKFAIQSIYALYNNFIYGEEALT